MALTATLHHDDVSVKKHFSPDLISGNILRKLQMERAAY